MSFFKRKWSDFEKWVMGISASLVVAAILAFVAFNSTEPKRDLAFLAGYDSATALALANKGENSPRLETRVTARLSKLGIEDIRYPSNSAEDEGALIVKFAGEVQGWLSAEDKALECAFNTGFAGFVKLNTPSMFPDFDIRKSATCAGFPPNDRLNDKDYLNWIFKYTGKEIEYI